MDLINSICTRCIDRVCNATNVGSKSEFKNAEDTIINQKTVRKMEELVRIVENCVSILESDMEHWHILLDIVEDQLYKGGLTDLKKLRTLCEVIQKRFLQKHPEINIVSIC